MTTLLLFFFGITNMDVRKQMKAENAKQLWEEVTKVQEEQL